METEKRTKSFRGKRKPFQRSVALLLALSVSVGGLSWTGHAGVAGAAAYTDGQGSLSAGSVDGAAQDIVHGFGSKIKEKKQKKVKTKVAKTLSRIMNQTYSMRI